MNPGTLFSLAKGNSNSNNIPINDNVGNNKNNNNNNIGNNRNKYSAKTISWGVINSCLITWTKSKENAKFGNICLKSPMHCRNKNRILFMKNQTEKIYF